MNKKFRWTRLSIALAIAAGAGLMDLILWIVHWNGVEFINQSIYFIIRGIWITAALLALMFFLKRFPKTRYVSRMITILAVVMVVSVWMTIFSWMPYQPYHYATVEHEGHSVVIMRDFTLDPAVAERLNESSLAYMERAEAQAAEAQSRGEAVEEVPNTVTDTTLLCAYAAYPRRLWLFFDRNADVEGRVYTLFGATSTQIMIDWPEDDVAHLYAEGPEGEGDSYTHLR